MRRIGGLLALPLVWFAAGCGDAGSGDESAATESGRDLTSLNSDLEEAAVASDLELGRTTAPVEIAAKASPTATPTTSAPATDAEVEAPIPAPALVSFVDGLDLASEPIYIEASLPIMGAGAGTLLQPGVTVASVGEPMELFKPVSRGDSPWPEAQTGEYPSVDRYGISLVVGRGGGSGGHCPRPGM